MQEAPLTILVVGAKVGDLDGVHDELNMPLQAEPARVMDDLNRIRALAGAA